MEAGHFISMSSIKYVIFPRYEYVDHDQSNVCLDYRRRVYFRFSIFNVFMRKFVRRAFILLLPRCGFFPNRFMLCK